MVVNGSNVGIDATKLLGPTQSPNSAKRHRANVYANDYNGTKCQQKNSENDAPKVE